MEKTKVDLIIENASEIVTAAGASAKPKTGRALDDLGIIRHGAIAIKNQIIQAVDTTTRLRRRYYARQVIDARRKLVMPGFVDPHTHLVFAGSRHHEYQAKITGESYSAQQKRGGGILYTVELTRKASSRFLVQKALKDLDICLKHGTTTLEIKSGYGLDRDCELKILNVIKTLKRRHPIDLVATFLGAHTVPVEYRDRRKEYIELVKSLLPVIKEQNLAEYCDVFCDDLGFSPAESAAILETALHYGFKIKAHAEQTGYLGGAVLAAAMGATSVDHLDYICEPRQAEHGWELKDDHLHDLVRYQTVGVLLPGVTYHLMEMVPGSPHYKQFLPATAKHLVQAGVPIALATDYNPGSCRTQSMLSIVRMAARLFRLSYAQVLNAATINAAHALNKAREVGSLEPGKKADILICDCEEHGILIDNFGINQIETVIKDGKIVVDNLQLVD